MKKLTTVNNGKSDSITDIATVEQKYNAKFVGQFCLKSKNGNWVNSPADIYYQAVPPAEGYSNYFALIMQDGSLYITSGESAVSGTFIGVVADNNEIVYSRYRHDYRTSSDGSTWIDGGRDYVKTTPTATTIVLKIVDGEFYEMDKTNDE